MMRAQFSYALWAPAVVAAVLACNPDARGDVVLNAGSSTGSVLMDGTMPVSGTATGLASATYLLANNATSNVQGVSVTEQVVRESGTGTLDFVYQVTNTGNATLSSISISAFDSFSARVGFTNTDPTGDGTFKSGTGAPTDFERSGDGNLINVIFGNGLAPGQTSDVFFVRTTASSFDTNGTIVASGKTLGVAGSNTITSGGSFSAAVPEPGQTTLLAGLGLVSGTAAFVRRRVRA